MTAAGFKFIIMDEVVNISNVWILDIQSCIYGFTDTVNGLLSFRGKCGCIWQLCPCPSSTNPPLFTQFDTEIDIIGCFSNERLVTATSFALSVDATFPFELKSFNVRLLTTLKGGIFYVEAWSRNFFKGVCWICSSHVINVRELDPNTDLVPYFGKIIADRWFPISLAFTPSDNCEDFTMDRNLTSYYFDLQMLWVATSIAMVSALIYNCRYVK